MGGSVVLGVKALGLDLGLRGPCADSELHGLEPGCRQTPDLELLGLLHQLAQRPRALNPKPKPLREALQGIPEEALSRLI